MAEQEAPKSEMPAEEKKWSEWIVVSTNNGDLRCKRVNLADYEDIEYRPVPHPTFSVTELAAFADFCKLELLGTSKEAAYAIYSRRYREIAFHMRDELNAPTPSAEK